MSCNKIGKKLLTGRQQLVKISKCKSSTKVISMGVPQGTILGSLFFTLYIKDIWIQLPTNSSVSYADDTLSAAK